MMYVLGAKESKGALYQQALIYAKVVEHFIKAEIDPIDIPGHLKQETIYKLLDRIRPKAEEEQPTVEAVDQRQAQAKGAKSDDAVHGSAASPEDEARDDGDDEAIDSDEGGVEAAEPAPNVEEGAPAADTTSDGEGDDLLDGVTNLKQERRDWEKVVIKRARAAWSEGYEVLLVSALKQPFDELVQLQGRGHVELRCEYEHQPNEGWVAIECLQVRGL